MDMANLKLDLKDTQTIGNSVSWERPASLMEELDSEDIQKGI